MSTNKLTPSLQGYRIALIGTSDDPITPSSDLLARAADILYFPVAQTLPPDSLAGLDTALTRSAQGEVQWLLLTTPSAVEAVAERVTHLDISPAALQQVKLALYGAKTTLTAATLLPDWPNALPFFSTRQQLVDAMRLTAADRVVIPLAQHAHPDWASLIEASGAEAIAVPAYRLILERGGDDLPGMLWGGQVDAIVFLTESSVRHFTIRLKLEGGSLDMLNDVLIACLDPQTAGAAQAYNLNAQVISATGDFADLAERLARTFSNEAANT